MTKQEMQAQINRYNCQKKRAFSTYSEALAFAPNDKTQRPYRCGVCGMIHRTTIKKRGKRMLRWAKV